MKKTIGIISFISVLILVAGFFILADPGTQSAGAPGSDRLEDQQTAISVETIPAVAGKIQDYIMISGDIKAASSVSVYPDVSGTLDSIRVNEGDYVQVDQHLAYVDPSRPGAAYSNSPVEAPIAGTVTEIYTEEGESVSTSIPVLEIGRLENLEIQAYVSERYVNRVALGQKALIKTDGLPGVQLDAVVSEISPIVDQTSRTMEITLSFSGSYTGIKAGMLADVILILEEKDNVVKIPEDALTERQDGFFVFVLKGSSVERRAIETGISIDGIVEITSGIEAGETIVSAGMTMLADGSLVKVVGENDPLPTAGNLEEDNA